MRIVVASRKGGVGKSTITAAAASILAADGRRVLAVDLDPQSNLAFMLGGDPTAPGSAELLITEQAEPIEVAKNLSVLPGGPQLSAIEITRLHPEDLADALDQFDYDDVLIDSPPGHEHLERLGVCAADIALIVTDAHPIAVVGAERVLEELERLRVKGRRAPQRWAVVANRIDKRRRLDQNVDKMLKDDSAPRFRVRQDSQIALASAMGIPISEHAPQSNAALDVRAVVEWCRG